MKIAIGNDHAGTSYKFEIIKLLEDRGHEVINHGTNAEDSVDYPDFAHQVAKDVHEGTANIGILICGSGNGVCMTANAHAGIRAGLAWESEIAALARQHNNANIICIPARFVSPEKGLEIVNAYLDAEFEGGRHERRVNKIKA